ncbi:methyltransferase domain-containing protein [Rossellomorea marisflavi]|uniref:class I SAM-dependent DNA methyltransferase n=1 Tax=Rossellomorea marisflavi TaxID=189381 RepID=UPI00203B7A32|nr:class I SAM-dependent methyltransferase [Rossellomorea marisflavi]MCM2591848.1 methyltransferase domain-containing protein [Rossellomorea marisflavi]
MSYEGFAYIYDHLMEDVPYDGWVDFLRTHGERYGNGGNRVLDIACGTGEISLKLIESGYDVTGVDLSSDMLMVAREKAERRGVALPLFNQDMAALDGLGSYDVVTIFCDSLNYLETEENVKDTFKSVHAHLEQDGVFLFDVHSLFKMDEIFMESSFTLTDEEVSYIWESFKGEYPHSVEHELTFFVRQEATGLYERVEELHKQRTYPVERYCAWLKEAGFIVKEITADYRDGSQTEDSERIFFTCVKNTEA